MAICPPRQLTIRQARTDDLPAIAQLLDEAGDWMRSHGITDHWPTRFPVSDLADRITRGELHIAYDNTTPVGTFALDNNADPEFWHDDHNSTAAGYLHRLAVARSYAGHGIGAQLVNHAARLVAESGRRWLRLDCAKNNATRLLPRAGLYPGWKRRPAAPQVWSALPTPDVPQCCRLIVNDLAKVTAS